MCSEVEMVDRLEANIQLCTYSQWLRWIIFRVILELSDVCWNSTARSAEHSWTQLNIGPVPAIPHLLVIVPKLILAWPDLYRYKLLMYKYLQTAPALLYLCPHSHTPLAHYQQNFNGAVIFFGSDQANFSLLTSLFLFAAQRFFLETKTKLNLFIE